MEAPIQWHSGFSVGIQVIDEQHQHMIEIINALFQELDTSTAEIDLTQFFEEAVNYGEYHFQTEETFFSRFDYPEKERHLAVHVAYKKNLSELFLKTGDSHLRASELLTFLETWWVEHITGIDQTLRALVGKDATTLI
jgi:hemerythrin-like metal-binding protein